MAIQIKHAFTSAKGDGGDATLVRPSNWNALHTTSMATGQLIGRLTAGTGVFEEIPISAYMAALLASADAAALATALGLFTTGDVKFTFATAAPAGWILMTGGTGTPPSTIGNAVSSAVLRANADVQALYILVYNAVSDTDAPVSGGRSGTALTDFNAGKTLRLPNLVGRSPIGAGGATDAPPGGGGATTARVIGRGYGVESATLITANLPPYTPAGSNGTVTVNPPGGTPFFPVTNGSIGNQPPAGGGGQNTPTTNTSWSSASSMTGAGPSWTGSPQGGASQAFSIIDPKVALNVMVKL